MVGLAKNLERTGRVQGSCASGGEGREDSGWFSGSWLEHLGGGQCHLLRIRILKEEQMGDESAVGIQVLFRFQMLFCIWEVISYEQMDTGGWESEERWGLENYAPPCVYPSISPSESRS